MSAPSNPPAREFRLPDIGEGLVDCEIVHWLVPVGAEVVIDQPLVEIETDKTVVEIPSPYAGVLVRHGAAEGERLAVGDVLVVIATTDATAAATALSDAPDEPDGHRPDAPNPWQGEDRPPQPDEPVPGGAVSGSSGDPQGADQAVEAPVEGRADASVGSAGRSISVGAASTGDAAPIVGSLSNEAVSLTASGSASHGPGPRPKALPKVRRLARDLGVDLRELSGTGPDGRITSGDVLLRAESDRGWARTGPPQPPAPAEHDDGQPFPPPTRTDDVQTVVPSTNADAGEASPPSPEVDEGQVVGPSARADDSQAAPPSPEVDQGPTVVPAADVEDGQAFPPSARADEGRSVVPSTGADAGETFRPPSPVDEAETFPPSARAGDGETVVRSTDIDDGGMPVPTDASSEGSSPSSGGLPPFSPLVRRIADARGVDLRHVTGTGPGGRITREDVLNAADAARPASDAGPSTPTPTAASPVLSSPPSSASSEDDRQTLPPSTPVDKGQASAPVQASPASPAPPPSDATVQTQRAAEPGLPARSTPREALPRRQARQPSDGVLPPDEQTPRPPEPTPPSGALPTRVPAEATAPPVAIPAESEVESSRGSAESETPEGARASSAVPAETPAETPAEPTPGVAAGETAGGEVPAAETPAAPPASGTKSRVEDASGLAGMHHGGTVQGEEPPIPPGSAGIPASGVAGLPQDEDVPGEGPPGSLGSAGVPEAELAGLPGDQAVRGESLPGVPGVAGSLGIPEEGLAALSADRAVWGEALFGAPGAPALEPRPVRRPAGRGGERPGHDDEDVERRRLSSVRRIIARRMTQSWTEIPQVTAFDEVDASRLLAARRALQHRHGLALPIDALVVAAVVPVLRAFPEVNASLEGDELVVFHRQHVGVAVDTPDGLLVAVVRDAGSKDLLDLAADVRRLGERARARALTPDELSGQTFTVSNIGAVGGGFGTPLVPPRTVAILSVGRATDKPIVRDGKVEVAPMMPLSLSYDHRVVDGAVGRRFLSLLMENLAEPTLFLV